MSRPEDDDDVIDGDGPNRNPIEGGEDPVQPRPTGSSQEAGRGEGGDQQKTASKGINPVQHSE